MSRPLLVFVDDAADRAAIRAVLACAEDRMPKVDCVRDQDFVTRTIEATWTRTDSPKREGSLRLNAFDCTLGSTMSQTERLAMFVRVLSAAVGGKGTDAELNRLHDDLGALSLHAAALHYEDNPAGKVDLAVSAAGTPWSRPLTNTSAPKQTASPTAALRALGAIRPPDTVQTLDEDGFHDLLPDMPDVVLVRDASFSNKGIARVGMGCLIGKSAPMSADAVELLRVKARFAKAA